VNRGNARGKATPWLFAILGGTLTILLVILNYILPNLKAARGLPETRIYITQSRHSGGDENDYGMIVQNLGKGSDEKINIKIVLESPSSIKSLRIHDPVRVKLIAKEEKSAAFCIERLDPGEWQFIVLKVAGRGNYSVSGWSEKSDKISKIYRVGMEFGPEETYRDWENKGRNPQER
jgi:hypothetical protein